MIVQVIDKDTDKEVMSEKTNKLTTLTGIVKAALKHGFKVIVSMPTKEELSDYNEFFKNIKNEKE